MIDLCFAQAQHTRKRPGWQLFSQIRKIPPKGKVPSTLSQLQGRKNKLYVTSLVGASRVILVCYITSYLLLTYTSFWDASWWCFKAEFAVKANSSWSSERWMRSCSGLLYYYFYKKEIKILSSLKVFGLSRRVSLLVWRVSVAKSGLRHILTPYGKHLRKLSDSVVYLMICITHIRTHGHWIQQSV